MRYKLTLKNIQISEKLNKDGRFIHTPEPSEVDEIEHELKSMYLLADWVYWASKYNKITNKRYYAFAIYFDTLPTVGEYFRQLLIKDGF
jgi:hypothetical protein